MADTQHQIWHAESLWQQLEPLLPGLSIEVVASIDSTNTRLIERARLHASRRGDGRGREASAGRRAADTQPCLLVAEAQTRGRGRQGRAWHSAPLSSLTFSLSMTMAPADWSGLSLAVGLAVAEALDPLPEGSDAPPRIGLKWPNDLMLQRAGDVPRKLGGVLIETVSVGSTRMAVVGVGLNLRPLANGEFATGQANLGELAPPGEAPDAPQVLARIALPLVRALQSFEREGFAPLAARFARRDLLAGRPVTTTLADLPEGVAEGVDDTGALRVRAGAAVRRVTSGDVSVRLDRPGS